MKKIIFIIVLFIVCFYNVHAKDISYSMNKYDDEIFNYIEKAYDRSLKEDGYVLGGSVLKEKIAIEDASYDDYQVLLVKYDKNDKLVWKYTYGNTGEDYIDYLTYTYDDNGNIDGYLIVTRETYDISEPNIGNNTIIIKIGLDGKLVYERNINDGVITKIIPTKDDNGTVDGYISILDTQIGSSLIRYNKSFDILLRRDFSETSISDLSIVNEDNKLKGYVVIVGNNLISMDSTLSNEINITDVNKYDSYNLCEANNGFILYGITSEVKLKNGDSSYYLINYVNNEEVWETIGETVTSKESGIILLPIKKSDIEGYFLLYKNEKDSAYEVVKVNLDGEVLKKVKKIKNSYYDFENFYSTGTTIYFVGQINCPEDDSCDYDNNSLYLVSDEDRVIEVKDDASTNIMAICAITIVLLASGIVIVRKRKRK